MHVITVCQPFLFTYYGFQVYVLPRCTAELWSFECFCPMGRTVQEQLDCLWEALCENRGYTNRNTQAPVFRFACGLSGERRFQNPALAPG